MNPILFTAAASADKAVLSQHVRANNMAHANTVGFKAILERSTPVYRSGDGFETSTTSRSNSTAMDFSAGKLTQTGRTLDIAINGGGFFAVQNPDGEENYTRAGNVEMSAEGLLSVNNHPLLNDADEAIILPEYQALSISDKGLMTIIPNGGGADIEVGQIKLVNPNTGDMALNSYGLFTNAQPLETDPIVQMASGHLENSNVSAISEMMSVMTSTRQYEMQVKMMKAADQLIASGNQLISARG